MKGHLTILLAGGVAALALLAAGCGGGNGSSSTTTTTASAADWANSFCTALTSWSDSLKSVGKTLASPSSLSKDGLQKAADQVKTANQQLADDLKGLGAPNTESGQQVKTAVDGLSTTLQDDVSKIQNTAQNVSGLTGVVSAASSIATTLSAMNTAFASTMTTIDNADAKGELQNAFKQTDSCKTILPSS